MHQEGEYLGTVVINPEKVNLNGHEYYKYSIEIHSLHPYKDTAKNDYINAKGRFTRYTQRHLPPTSHTTREYAVVEGTPQSPHFIEEEGQLILVADI